MWKGKRNVYYRLKQTHPLSEYYTPKDANSTDTVTCIINNCGSSIGRRPSFIVHLKTFHPQVWLNYKKNEEEKARKEKEGMQEEETVTKPEYEKFISAETEGVRFNMNTALLYDLTKNRPHLTYVKLEKSVLDKKVLRRPNINPVVDTSLPPQNQLAKADFLHLPKNYQRGHMLSRLFFSNDEEILKKMDKYSHCVVQHGTLNDGLWSKMEGFARTATALGNVRVVVITLGDHEFVRKVKTRSIPPEWFYMLLVFSNHQDKDWRYLAYKFPNENCTEGLNFYEISIDTLRRETEFNLFSTVFPTST